VKLPTFPECKHSTIRSLINSSDQELIHLFQQHREQGQYFTTLFCRYSHLVYSLINRFAQWSTTERRSSPVQAEYLFAKIWQHIFHELRNLNLAAEGTSVPDDGPELSPEISLQNWILNTTATCINQTELPPVEAIHYSLSAASPPLWCYLEKALDRLPTTLRLMVIMAQTFHWSETRIAAYLQAEGENISPAEVQARLQEGYQLLETSLPEDIQEIYLGFATPKVPLKLD
jgi:hypothetical protein